MDRSCGQFGTPLGPQISDDRGAAYDLVMVAEPKRREWTPDEVRREEQAQRATEQSVLSSQSFHFWAFFGNFGYDDGVSSVDRKRELFQNIVRLRRAAREAPGNRDILMVRSALERELGETVSLRLAASLLGVSHTALRRWIKAGDLPTVFSRAGRDEVPVSALVELYEAVKRQRRPGGRRSHVLEPIMSEGRSRAERLKAHELVPEGDDRDSHERPERRSLAYHRALGRRLRRHMVDQARQTLWQWRDADKIDPIYADQWEEVLSKPVAEVRRAIGEDSQAGRDLRQNSPFAGMLSEPERRRIMQQVR